MKRIKDGKQVAVKILDYGKMGEKEKQQLVNEVNILREMKHPFIVKYEDRIIDKEKQKIYILMEYCEGGDLGSLIKSQKRKNCIPTEDLLWKIVA